MAEVRFLPPAAKYLKKLKDKKLKALYQDAIDKICKDHMAGEPKTGDLSGVYGYDIYYNKTNYELAYTLEYLEDKVTFRGDIPLELKDICFSPETSGGLLLSLPEKDAQNFISSFGEPARIIGRVEEGEGVEII